MKMKQFVGIDLGTTNSAICLYDGSEVRVLKSPEQNDVTPSAILIDRRGNKYIGKRAYDAAPGSPDNAALLFKRLMGSSTRVRFAAAGVEMSPEECSAEVLKVLFGYLPEELRHSDELGAVITIPAAFNQMQKNATVQAAHLAGIGKVALMQEPVAAVMSVMRSRRTEGIFLIYDLGGGTLDVAIAESIGGRVNLLANGGIQMCGGRDIDRAVFDGVVKPWLLANFRLPEGFMGQPAYRRLVRFANWAVERAKIELSSSPVARISLSESELCTRDEDGEEMYLDVELSREALEGLMEEKVEESVLAVRETMEKAGLSPEDIEKIVFIGGPTNYKPLRDKVSQALGIASSTEVNPMTAVAEGAALFAESIDWESEDHARKSSRARLDGGAADISFVYTARTAELRARLVVRAPHAEPGCEYQVDSADTGWTSGRCPLQDGASLVLSLPCKGDNTFRVFVFRADGSPVELKEQKIVIRRTTATVDMIPASHSIGIAVKDNLSASASLAWLVRAGDALPKKGELRFKAAETLRAGSNAALHFNLWEGEITHPVTDNRPIGSLKVRGTDFDDGVITAGAELVCEYEVLDSGAIRMEVSVPDIGASFPSSHNFYSHQDGQLDFAAAGEQIRTEAESLTQRLEELDSKGVQDERLSALRERLRRVTELVSGQADIEQTQEAQERLLETKRRFAAVRGEHLQEIRTIELNNCAEFFDKHVREHARSTEQDSFEALRRTARRHIEQNSAGFEEALDEMRGLNFTILWRQDWFVIDYFRRMVSRDAYSDRAAFEALQEQGMQAIRRDDIEQLRSIVARLSAIRLHRSGEADFADNVNIIRA